MHNISNLIIISPYQSQLDRIKTDWIIKGWMRLDFFLFLRARLISWGRYFWKNWNEATSSWPIPLICNTCALLSSNCLLVKKPSETRVIFHYIARNHAVAIDPAMQSHVKWYIVVSRPIPFDSPCLKAPKRHIFKPTHQTTQSTFSSDSTVNKIAPTTSSFPIHFVYELATCWKWVVLCLIYLDVSLYGI